MTFYNIHRSLSCSAIIRKVLPVDGNKFRHQQLDNVQRVGGRWWEFLSPQIYTEAYIKCKCLADGPGLLLTLIFKLTHISFLCFATWLMTLPALQHALLPLCLLATPLTWPFFLPAFWVWLSCLYFLPSYQPISFY